MITSASVGRNSSCPIYSAYSTTSGAETPSIATSASPSEQLVTHPSSKGSRNGSPLHRKRRYGTILSVAIFLSLGYVSGRTFSLFLFPPPLPKVGSQEDGAYLQRLDVEGDRLPMVQELRSHPEEWEELRIDNGEGGSKSLLSKQSTFGPDISTQIHFSELLKSIIGSFGIGYYRVFWNARQKRTVTVLHLGVSLSGWPSIVHGGCLATLLQESMESLALLTRATAAIDSKETETKQHSHLRSMQLKYKRPTHSERFYVIRTDTDHDGQQHQYTIKTHIEDAQSGLITAEAVGETLS